MASDLLHPPVFTTPLTPHPSPPPWSNFTLARLQLQSYWLTPLGTLEAAFTIHGAFLVTHLDHRRLHWTLPPARHSSGVFYGFPSSRMAHSVVLATPRIAVASGFCFPGGAAALVSISRPVAPGSQFAHGARRWLPRSLWLESRHVRIFFSSRLSRSLPRHRSEARPLPANTAPLLWPVRRWTAHLRSPGRLGRPDVSCSSGLAMLAPYGALLPS